MADQADPSIATMRATFTIEPSDNNGVGAWVRPIDAEKPTYWKWYQEAHHAMLDAHDMGLERSQASDCQAQRADRNRHRS